MWESEGGEMSKQWLPYTTEEKKQRMQYAIEEKEKLERMSEDLKQIWLNLDEMCLFVLANSNMILYEGIELRNKVHGGLSALQKAMQENEEFCDKIINGMYWWDEDEKV